MQDGPYLRMYMISSADKTEGAMPFQGWEDGEGAAEEYLHLAGGSLKPSTNKASGKR